MIQISTIIQDHYEPRETDVETAAVEHEKQHEGQKSMEDWCK